MRPWSDRVVAAIALLGTAFGEDDVDASVVDAGGVPPLLAIATNGGEKTTVPNEPQVASSAEQRERLAAVAMVRFAVLPRRGIGDRLLAILTERGCLLR